MDEIYAQLEEFLKRYSMNLSELSISLTDFPLDHICYRAKTSEDFNKYAQLFKANSVLYTSRIFHERIFYCFVLRKPLDISGYSLPYIEFSEPGGSDSYENGFQHIEFHTNLSIPEIVKDKTNLDKYLFAGKFGDETYLKWSDKTALKVKSIPFITSSLLEDKIEFNAN